MLNATAALTADEERALIPAAQAGDEAATAALAQSQIRWLRAEARKYGAASGVDSDDLVSAGLEALLGAIRTFDPTRGARLFTHAQTAMREAMADEVAGYGSTIAIPGRTLRKYRRALRETETVDEAREFARERDGMDPATFDAVRYALAGKSLDERLAGGRAASAGEDPRERNAVQEPGDALAGETRTLGSRGPAPEGTAVARSLARQALAVLDDRQREIVALAVLAEEPLSHAAIADRLGTSRPTVTRTLAAALDAMRGALTQTV